MANLPPKLDPPPINRDMFENGTLASDWHRWFQAMYLNLKNGTGGVGGGGTGTHFDGGHPDTVFDGTSLFDLGGVE